LKRVPVTEPIKIIVSRFFQADRRDVFRSPAQTASSYEVGDGLS
jgi:hypothetical protein